MTEPETTQLTVREACRLVCDASICNADVVEAIDSLYNRGMVNYNDARTIAAGFGVEWD